MENLIDINFMFIQENEQKILISYYNKTSFLVQIKFITED